jgi:hypothetical protein
MSTKVKQDLETIRSDLNKRQTFLSGCLKAETIFNDLIANQSSLLQDKEVIETVYSVISRVSTLLRTRYTDQVFWRAGRKVFISGESIFMNSKLFGSNQRLKTISECKKLADGELKDEEVGQEKKYNAPSTSTLDPETSPASTTPPTLQLDPSILSQGTAPPPEMEMQMVAQLLGSLFQQAQQQRSGANGSRDDEEGDGNGMGDLSRFMDGDTLLEMVMRQSQEDVQGPPPASRDARHNLHVITIEQEGVVCSVCQEEFRKGSKAKQLPCKHFFHYKCSLEWLERV